MSGEFHSGLIENRVISMLRSAIVLVGLGALVTDPGFAAVVSFTLFEGNAYRLVDSNGNDIPNIVLGGVGLCNPGLVGTCDATTPLLPNDVEGTVDRSDKALWVAINNVAGARTGTGLLFCSDTPPNEGNDNNVVSPAVWNNPVDCGSNTGSGAWVNLNKFIFENTAVGGVETTPYMPVANTDVGFWPGNTTTYNLVSDIPEPSPFMLFGSALLIGLGAVWVKRRSSNPKSTSQHGR